MLKLGAGFYLLLHTPQVYSRSCMGLKSSPLRYSTIQLFRWFFFFFKTTPQPGGSGLPQGSLQAYNDTRSENQHSDFQEGGITREKVQDSYLSRLMMAFLFDINGGSLSLCCYSPCISSGVSCHRWFSRKRCWVTISQDRHGTENRRVWGVVSLNVYLIMNCANSHSWCTDLAKPLHRYEEWLIPGCFIYKYV